MKTLTLSLLLVVFLFTARGVGAIEFFNQTFKDKEKTASTEFRDKAGYAAVGEQDPLALVGQLINTFLGLLGVIFLLLVVYGGFKWMTAQGAEEDVKKAKDTITQAVIGLIIIMAAYAISNFVIGKVQEKTLKTTRAVSVYFV